MSNFYGLIGEKLGHSISPKIHNLILKELNLKGLYNLFEVKKENLEQSIQGLKNLECKGVNVTIPYKIDVMPYLDNISIEAKKIGAVNTIAFNDNLITGYNTDYYGFLQTLKIENIDVKNKKAVILGTGGASKAVVQCLLDNEISEITYLSRNPKKNNEYIKKFNVISYREIENLKNHDIIINCTPCGMYPNIECSPVDKKVLKNFNVAIDLIYNPSETLFLKFAKDAGIKGINGLYMLVAQAVASQEIWNKIKIDINITNKIYKFLSEDI